MKPDITLETIVTFGRYKGKPVASLLGDIDYCLWLQSQASIVEKWPHLIKAIREGIEISNEDHCTPVHNEMQLRFLDRAVAHKVLCAIKQKTQAALRLLEANDYRVVFEPISGFDVQIQSQREFGILVELKPVISDDYPAVLRKIARIGRASFPYQIVVICDEFNSSIASFEQAVEFFNTQKVSLLRWSDLEKIRSEITEVGQNMYWVH